MIFNAIDGALGVQFTNIRSPRKLQVLSQTSFYQKTILKEKGKILFNSKTSIFAPL
jgi:hypothetical protein